MQGGSMSCATNKFVITKGKENTFIFTIKADSSTKALELTGTDTFYADLRKLEDDSEVITNKQMAPVGDLIEGRIQLVLTAVETANLESLKGRGVDRYYLKPVYRLILRCSTAGNGNFIAKVCNVYVD